jgi:hypothetical protein
MKFDGRGECVFVENLVSALTVTGEGRMLKGCYMRWAHEALYVQNDYPITNRSYESHAYVCYYFMHICSLKDKAD